MSPKKAKKQVKRSAKGAKFTIPIKLEDAIDVFLQTPAQNRQLHRAEILAAQTKRRKKKRKKVRPR